jgi:hypothetical protein
MLFGRRAARSRLLDARLRRTDRLGRERPHRGQLVALRRDDRAGSGEDERESADELRESSLEGVPIHASSRTNGVGWIVRGIVPRAATTELPDVNCGKEMRPMSAEILKRKLRNFPVASLNERIATS